MSYPTTAWGMEVNGEVVEGMVVTNRLVSYFSSPVSNFLIRYAYPTHFKVLADGHVS